MLFLFLVGATVLAVAILLLPLLRPAAVGPGQPRPQAAWRTALAIALFLPLIAFALYVGSGRPMDWMNAQSVQHAQGVDLAQARSLTDELARRLEAEPDNLEGWLLLARSRLGTGQAAEALSAYARVLELSPDEPDLLVEYANALSRQQGRSLAGKPTELIERALALAPDNLNALALGGAAALQRGQPRQAQAYWTHLRDLTPEGSPDRTRIEALLARVAGEGAEPATVVAAQPDRSRPAAARAFVRGVVQVSPQLAGRFAAGDTLFVFARAVGGSSRPIAAVRKQATGWPVAFVLDDGTSMMQDQALSAFSAVDLVARVSHSGSPTAQPGDLEGSLGAVAVGTDGLELVLDRVVGE